MKIFEDMVEIRALIALIFVAAYCIFPIFKIAFPEGFKDAFLLIIGFLYGGKSTWNGKPEVKP